jgi:hypothetical protein
MCPGGTKHMHSGAGTRDSWAGMHAVAAYDSPQFAGSHANVQQPNWVAHAAGTCGSHLITLLLQEPPFDSSSEPNILACTDLM